MIYWCIVSSVNDIVIVTLFSLLVSSAKSCCNHVKACHTSENCSWNLARKNVYN